MKATIALLLLMSGCLVMGCGKKDDDAKPATESTGVAECDDYFARVDHCPSSPTQTAVLEKTKAQMRVMFKSMATTPAGREKLRTDCLDHLRRLPATCTP
jgi:hypothetical protein